MNSQRRIDGPPFAGARRRRAVKDAEGSVPALYARLEAAYPVERRRNDDRWSPAVRLATLAAGCLGSWGVVALVVRVAAPLI